MRAPDAAWRARLIVLGLYMLHYLDKRVRRCTLDGCSAGSNATELKSRMHRLSDPQRVGCAEAMNSGVLCQACFFCSHRRRKRERRAYCMWKRMDMRSDRWKDTVSQLVKREGR